MADETYNGWTNRETWTVHLWLTNDSPELYVGARAAARAVDTFYDDNIENYARNALDDDAPGFATDLINCALSRCNWREVADALRED